MPTTWIKNIDWLVAWDRANPETLLERRWGGRHSYIRDADLVFTDGEILFAGRGYAGPADRVIDGRGRFIIPGLVNIHTHPCSEPMMKGLSEERKSRQLQMSSLYEYIFLLGRPTKDIPADAEDQAEVEQFGRGDFPAYSASAQVAISELLTSGVTTFVDYSAPRPNWLDEVAATGIRTCVAPSFRSGAWYTPNGHEVLYRWDVAGGRRAFDRALETIEAARRHPSGRLMGMLAPAQVDTCTADLFVDASAVAREKKIPIQTHAAQSVVEYREMFRRHGKTPIEWLESLGVLGPEFIVGHGIFLDEHPWIMNPDHRDLDRLADSGTTVAHCPNQFARGGMVLHHFGKYVKRGVNMGIGTDTFPHNMIDEMRWALTVAKIASADIGSTSISDVFHAATVGGAAALMRDDIGRLEKGCKADFVVIDLDHPHMVPARDPLKSLVVTALERPIEQVWVGGETVVQSGRALKIDMKRNLDGLTEGQRRGMLGISERDWARRSPDEAFPMALGTVGSNQPPAR
ncbi:ethylammeline chlorohydrolase [Allostella vacuolata]|nr:ethylammeline chlorohydrolase [Stella vacuolata]